MSYIEGIYEKLRRHPKRIVFAEGENPLVLRAANDFCRLGLGPSIVLGDRDRIRSLASSLSLEMKHVRVIDPAASPDLEVFCQRLATIRRYQGMKAEDVRNVVVQPNYFASMMVQYSYADGLVSGVSSSTFTLLRAVTSVIKPLAAHKPLSSCMIVEVDRRTVGDNGVLYLADCGVIPDPTVEQLAEIGLESARLARLMSGDSPRVAFLSFSTQGSAQHKLTEKVVAAAALCRQKAAAEHLPAEIDGEMQVDAALDPEIARDKCSSSLVAGRANVLIFPDLNAGNIALKLLQVTGNARLYGHLLLGLERPAADVSRGATSEDILGIAAIIGLRAVEYHHLYAAHY